MERIKIAVSRRLYSSGNSDFCRAQRGAPDQHISKRTKRAETTPNPEGSGLNTESSSEIVAMDVTELVEPLRSTFNDVATWLGKQSVFENLFSDHPDNVVRRGHLLERLRTDLKKGHDIVAVLVEDDTRNHLMWDFRRWAVKRVGTNDAALEERKFTTTVINEDGNNYHAWSHRQWVFRTFVGDWNDGLWEDELVYCAQIIEDDPFNSFAWDQRHFVLTRWLVDIDGATERGDYDRIAKVDNYFDTVRDGEVKYAVKAIEAEPGNQCPWTHIRGLYTVDPGSLGGDLHVRGTILRVLEDERDRVCDLKVSGGIMDDGFVSSMNARGVMNALNMLLDLLTHGFFREVGKEPGEKFRNVLDVLCTKSPCLLYVQGDVFEILRHVDNNLTASGLAWRNMGPRAAVLGLSSVANIEI